MTDEWDDLFAKAAASGMHEQEHSTQDVVVKQQDCLSCATQDDDHQPNTKRRRKRRRGRHDDDGANPKHSNSNSTSSSCHDGFQAMLASRRTVPTIIMNNAAATTTTNSCGWPEWTRLGESMNEGKACTCWKPQQHHHSSSACQGTETTTRRQFQFTNQQCLLNPLQHRLEVDTRMTTVVVDDSGAARLRLGESGSGWPFHMFCCVRNLRCIGVVIAMKEVANPQLLLKACRAEAGLVKRLMRQAATSGRASLDVGEAEILDTKCQMVVDASSELVRQTTMRTTEKRQVETTDSGPSLSPLFDQAIRLIIACDDFYYRLYYLQLSMNLPAALVDDNAAALICLPHPAEYFHAPYLAWAGMDDSDTLSDWNHFLSFAASFAQKSPRPCHCDKLANEIVARHGVDPLNVDGQQQQWQPPCTSVMVYLHRNRSMETARLFFKSGWMASRTASEQTMSALEAHIDTRTSSSRHETPSPSVLAEWRDMCRDKLCNLYAFATLSDGAVGRIKKVLSDVGSSGVIEMGAGTGYLAATLREAGVNVRALDIHPPGNNNDTMNDYHGRTPSFCEIGKGDASDLRGHYLGRKVDSALLLCYPPPESRMAKEALEAYSAMGGRCLIHIGEFAGLTGSRDFENLLVSSFYCVDRFPCLSWGTDAAEVTMWVRNNDSAQRNGACRQTLLPCSNCGKSSASRRCRLVRYVVYCSQSCFEEHSAVLSVFLALAMVPINVETLDYGNSRHFMPIALSLGAIGGKTKARANKPRKRTLTP